MAWFVEMVMMVVFFKGYLMVNFRYLGRVC